MRKWIRGIVVVILIALVSLTPLFFTISCSSNDGTRKVFIYDVHDGDTFTYGKDENIRLFGVDTPEISDQYNGFIATTGIEYMYAVEARDFAASLVLNKNVTQEVVTMDDYGREVSRVYVDGKDLGEELVKSGMGRIAYFSMKEDDKFYSTEFEYYQKLTQLQYDAYYAGVGVWANKELFKTIFPKA